MMMRIMAMKWNNKSSIQRYERDIIPPFVWVKSQAINSGGEKYNCREESSVKLLERLIHSLNMTQFNWLYSNEF